MKESEFFQLCLHQYDKELGFAENPFPRGQFLWGGQTFLVGTLITITPKGLLTGAENFAQISFKLAFSVAIVSLGIGIFFTIKALYPRSGYRSLGSLGQWKNWRDEYYKMLTEEDSNDVEGNRSALEEETLKALTEDVIDITTINGKIYNQRMAAFKRSFLFTSIALTFVFVQGLIYAFFI